MSIRFYRVLKSAFLASCVLSQLTFSQTESNNTQAWKEDLQFLVEQIDQAHPNPYHGVNQDVFQQAYEELYDNLPELTDDQVIAEFMRLFGLLSTAGKEGHSGVNPQEIFGMIPIYLYRFEDGWFVMNASEEFTDLIGAQVIAIDGTPIENVENLISPLVPSDNDTNLIIRIPRYLIMPRLLSALGVTMSGNAMNLDLVLESGEKVGRTISVDNSWSYPFLPPENQEQLWLSDITSEFWRLNILEENNALYVRFNMTMDISPKGETLENFIEEILNTFDDNGLDRLILDVRLNGGGDNTTFSPLVSALKNHPGINRLGSLYALIGRGTFSAAGNLITVLEQETNVILVGEPTGGGPNQYGDAVNIELPNHSELIIRVATVYHEFDSSSPDRLTHEPLLRVTLRSADYFNSNDPVLDRALSHMQ